MKRLLYILIMSVVAVGWMRAEEPLAYVLEFNDEVNAKMWMITKRALVEAQEKRADLVVIHLNTYGGAVDAADSIRTALLRLPIPTVAFIDPNAASAGSLISLACDSVYMSPGASLGASTVVTPDGSPAPDKYQSYMKSIMRSTAESHGKRWNEETGAWEWRRDPAIAEHWVTPDSVLTFTPEEAIAHGYAEGMATSVDEVIAAHLEQPYRVEYFNSTATDHILGFLANAGVRAVLIMLILGGIYMEMQSPGLSFAGAVAFVAAVLYFLPMAVNGTMAPWVIVLFLIGLVLLALEMFVIPGFGICGVCGIIAILASIVGAMFYGPAMEGGYAVDIVDAVTITSVGVVLAVGLTWFLTSKYGPKCIRRVSELQTELRVSDGYSSVDTSLKHYVGSEAETVTDLRPSGKIEIGGKIFDAVSIMGFIDARRAVKVVKFENAQLYVSET
ncbi:MAG: nodulation protein NfeD [Bacteroidales bacterium]|nr:nodulation protein NfeD [Bacteroidales bacterium]